MPGIGVGRGEQLPAPRHRAVPPRCPAAGHLGGQSVPVGARAAHLGRARTAPPGAGQRESGWITDGLMGFVSSPQGGIVGGNRLGTGKISDLSMNQRGRNENPLLPNFPCLALLPNESLPCQMQDKNVPPPHDCILKKAFTRQKCFTRKICQVNSKET